MESGDGRLDIHFIQLPSVSREVWLKQWVVWGLPKCDTALKINLEVDLLVIPEVANEEQYVVQSFKHLHGGDSQLSTFRIHLLQLSDGFPHPLAPIDPDIFYIGYKSRKILSSLDILVSRHRLVATAPFKGMFYFGCCRDVPGWTPF
jgi:hypothetical protein